MALEKDCRMGDGEPVGCSPDAETTSQKPFPTVPYNAWTALLICGWTLFFVTLFFWQNQKIDQKSMALATTQARALFEKDVLYRKWASMHGGVYAPVTEQTPSNPYLHVKERDITTPSGRKLTLVNPAYMTRQVAELGAASMGILGHITSLKPIRPQNAPDPWERQALQAFNKGAHEWSTLSKLKGGSVLRYMAPLKTERSCLACHAKQGYKEGDVRGGISVTVPMAPFLTVASAERRRVGFSLALSWLLGVCGILVANLFLRRSAMDLAAAQGALREKNQFFDGVLNTIQDGIGVLAPDLTVLYTNKVMEKWYAKSLPLCGKKCYEAYHAGHSPCRPCPSLRSMETGKMEMDVVPGYPDGDIRWLELYSYPMKDETTGQVTAVVEFVRDVTQRIADQETLRRLAAAFEQTQHFIVITDPQGGIEYVNPYFERETGYRLEDVRGKLPLAFRTTVEAEELFYRETLPALQAGETWNRRMEAVVEDGTHLVVDLTASPVMDENGRLVNIIFVSRNITREVELEAQLQQAQKMEAVGQLAGGVAHDFNNLLQVINGYGELALHRSAQGESVKREVESIVNAGGRAAELVRQLLTFGRRQLLRPEDLELNEVVEHSLKMLARLIGEDIRIHFHRGSQLSRIHADRTLVEQVLMNLAANARDAMPEGGRLDIAIENVVIDDSRRKEHRWAKAGRYVLLSVADTGHGMDEKTLERIFDPFFTTKEVGKGTGLGLASVYGIVKQHDGLIHVSSELDKGTVFKIYFPALEEGAAVDEIEPKGSLPRGNETILVAEDDDKVRNIAMEVLKNAGYNVIEAANGSLALEWLEHNDESGVDGLLLDVVMPEVSGWKVYQQMRLRFPALPVLFMSGYSEDAVHTNYVLKAGYHLIQKPFSAETLLRAIRAVLDEGPRPEGDRS